MCDWPDGHLSDIVELSFATRAQCMLQARHQALTSGDLAVRRIEATEQVKDCVLAHLRQTQHRQLLLHSPVHCALVAMAVPCSDLSGQQTLRRGLRPRK